MQSRNRVIARGRLAQFTGMDFITANNKYANHIIMVKSLMLRPEKKLFNSIFFVCACVDNS